jgi:succinate--hydroxymethylglutarate CoA-transferase
MGEQTRGKGLAVCVSGIGERDVDNSPINNIEQTFSHPQAIARKVVEEVYHPRAGKIKMPAAAVSYDGKKMAVSQEI